MNFFEKEPSKNGKAEHFLALTARQISLLSSGILLSCFFIFISGYFLGKKNASEQFLYKIEQESLADQIYSSMCILSDKDEIESNEDGDANESDGEETENEQDSTTIQADNSQVAENQEIKLTPQVKGPLYFAQLAGFGSQETANKFALKLKAQGYPVTVVERSSKTAKGKTVFWYQVVTEKFEKKDDLITLVNTIKKSERLNGVQMVTA
jgi:hypothetical protein